MKANELMIGDWVLTLESTHKEKVYAQIWAIEEGQTSILVKIDNCNWFVDIEWIEPIPLTEEILKKNGFENDFYEEESVADYHTIRLEGYSLRHNIGEADGYLVTWCNGGINVTTDVNGCVQKDISYVHELQHALRLCGIEHEITL